MTNKDEREAALIALCGVDCDDDLSSPDIRFSRKVVDGMFDAGYDAAENPWHVIETADDLPDEDGNYWWTCRMTGTVSQNGMNCEQTTD